MCLRKKRRLAAFLAAGLFFSVPAVVSGQPFGVLRPGGGDGPRQQVLSSADGRFVFGQISGSPKDRFMLDTRTGRLWRIAESGALGMFLKPVPYHDEKATGAVLPPPVPLHSKKRPRDGK